MNYGESVGDESSGRKAASGNKKSVRRGMLRSLRASKGSPSLVTIGTWNELRWRFVCEQLT